MSNLKNLFLFVLIGMVYLLVSGCSSMHCINSKSNRLADNSGYAVIKVKTHGLLSGQLLKESDDPDVDPAYWDPFLDIDSMSKGLAKVAFGLTPMGMLTKPRGDMPVLYRVPPGKVNILAFNYYKRLIPKKNNETERAGWGTIISADVKAGSTYTVDVEMVPTDKSQFGEIPAYLALKDEQGNTVQTDSYFFNPKEEISYTNFRYTHMTVDRNSAIYKEASLANKTAMNISAPVAGAITDEMMAYFKALGEFGGELEARKKQAKD